MRQKQITSGVLGILVVLVVISLTRNLIGYGSWLLHTKETTEKTVEAREKAEEAREKAAAARTKKMGARELEVKLREAQVVRADSQVRCEPVDRDWDYVCNHLPMPQQSTMRLQFGISVDANRWLAASPEVPLEADVPRPARKSARR